MNLGMWTKDAVDKGYRSRIVLLHIVSCEWLELTGKTFLLYRKLSFRNLHISQYFKIIPPVTIFRARTGMVKEILLYLDNLRDLKMAYW